MERKERKCSCGKILFHKLMNRRRCPKCGDGHIVYKRKRKLRLRGQVIDNYCVHCKKSFVSSNAKHKIYPKTMKEDILRLLRTRKRKDEINKWDFTRDYTKKRFPSTRDIALKLNVSKSYVWQVIKNE